MLRTTLAPSEPAANAAVLRDVGMSRSAARAEKSYPGWTDEALGFVEEYARDHAEFAGEDVREASRGIVPEPPHLRSWGSVMTRAAREGFIEKTDRVRPARNPNVHCGNVNIWRSQICMAEAA